MTAEEKSDLYDFCILGYGLEYQTLMLAEECSELVKTASKACRYHKDPQKEIEQEKSLSLVGALTEEIADVEIMIEQMEQFYCIPKKEVERIKQKKLERLVGRIRSANEKRNFD